MRAIAVGLVIVAHAGVDGFAGGFVGVDVFFVLSGFLITSLLLREADRTGRISIPGFYTRRARRILPAATVVLLAVLAYAALRLSQARLEQTMGDAGWSAVFLANWHMADVGTDYFAATEPSLLQHYWSLAVEEQFYLVWPLLAMLLVPRIRRRAFAIVTAAALLVSLAWSMHVTGTDPTAAYFSTPARAYELAGGALLACVGGPVLRSPWRFIAGLVGVVLLAVATFGFDESTAFPGWHALVPTVATVALLLAGPRAFTGRVLSCRPLRYLGDISYSLYLWHWPILLLAPDFLPGHGLVRTALAGAVILVVSSASYHFIEQPFQRKRVPFLSHGHRPLVLWPTALILVFTTAWAASGYASHQIAEQRDDARHWFETHHSLEVADGGVPNVRKELRGSLDLADQGAPVPPSVDAASIPEKHTWNQFAKGCYAHNGETTVKDCTFGDTDAHRTLALVGDSHAAMWLSAFDQIGRKQGFRVKLFAKNSCAHYRVFQPAKGMTDQECNAFRDWTLDRLADLHPDTILVAARGQLFMHRHNGVSIADQWTKAVTVSASELTRLSDDVRVLGDIPNRQSPDNCLSRPDADQAACIAEPTGPSAESNRWTKAALTGTGVPYVNMQRYVCVDGRCPMIVGDIVVYQDDSHVNRRWADHIAPRIGKELAPLAK